MLGTKKTLVKYPGVPMTEESSRIDFADVGGEPLCCRRRRLGATVADNTDNWTDPPTLKGENGLVQIQCTFISQWGRSWYEFSLASVAAAAPL